MLRIPVRILFFSCLIGMAGCHKDDPTIINGTVVDAKTGAPIPGVYIYGGIYDGGMGTGEVSVYTGTDGNFTIRLQKNEGFSGLTLHKTGYVEKFSFVTPYNSGKVNHIEVLMHPKDGTLRLVFENTQAIEKTIYLQAQSNTFTQEYGQLPYIITQPYPFKCKPNQADTIDYPFTSDEQINLYWGFSYYEKVGQAPFRDSLYLSRGDSAVYSIIF